MRRLVLLGLLIMTTLLSVAFAGNGIGVVDMQEIFQSSPQIKKINDQLTQQFSSRRDDIVKSGKELQSDIANYQKNQSVMNEKDLSALRDKISQEQLNVRQQQAKFQQDLYQAQNAKMSAFMDQLKAIVKNIANDKQLNVVVPKNTLLYSSDNLDITSEILEKLK